MFFKGEFINIENVNKYFKFSSSSNSYASSKNINCRNYYIKNITRSDVPL